VAKMTFEQVKDWASNLEDNGSPFCEECLTRMVRASTEGSGWKCPNSMCKDDQAYPEGEEEES